MPLENVNVDAAIKASLALVHNQAKNNNIVLNYQPLDLAARGNSRRLKQVLVNLLTNAIKYTSVNGSIHIQAKLQDEFVRISIRDTGQGIVRLDGGECCRSPNQ